MFPKERVLSVFDGQHDNRPVDIGSCLVTGVPMELHRYLTLGMDQTPAMDCWADEIMDQAHLSHDAAAKVGSDVLRAGFVFNRIPLRDNETRSDRFGIQWLNVDGQPTPTSYPFEHLTIQEILRHPLPDPGLVEITSPIPGTGYAIMCDAPISGVFELANKLRGYGKLQEDFADQPRLVSALLDHTLEIAIEWYDNILDRLPVKPDLIMVTEDLGYQKTMALSPQNYRTFIKPRQRKLIHHIKSKSEARIVLHSCGAIGPILKDLCDLEIDALHVQPDARNMHPSSFRQSIPENMVLYGMLDMSEWLPSLISGTGTAITNLMNYLEICQPVIVGPADLISPHIPPQYIAQAITNLLKII